MSKPRIFMDGGFWYMTVVVDNGVMRYVQTLTRSKTLAEAMACARKNKAPRR